MRTEIFLVLLMTLVFTDGLDNVTLSRDKRGLFSNWEYPCQRSQKNNAYNTFNHRHILSEEFDMNSKWAWADYLKRRRLCGRKSSQSFLPQSYTDSIIRICNGRGTRDTGNLCISTESFTVYIVQSALRNGQCEVKKPRNNNILWLLPVRSLITNVCLFTMRNKLTRNHPNVVRPVNHRQRLY